MPYVKATKCQFVNLKSGALHADRSHLLTSALLCRQQGQEKQNTHRQLNGTAVLVQAELSLGPSLDHSLSFSDA